jgi:hypothetical protein
MVQVMLKPSALSSFFTFEKRLLERIGALAWQHLAHTLDYAKYQNVATRERALAALLLEVQLQTLLEELKQHLH